MPSLKCNHARPFQDPLLRTRTIAGVVMANSMEERDEYQQARVDEVEACGFEERHESILYEDASTCTKGDAADVEIGRAISDMKKRG